MSVAPLGRRLRKAHEPDPLPMPDGLVPQVQRLTLAGVQDAFRPWWTPQHTLNHLNVLYEAGLLSYPRTDGEAFPGRMASEACEWVREAAVLFRAHGWALPAVDDWMASPDLFDDQKVGMHTGLHPVLKRSRSHDPLAAPRPLDSFTVSPDQILLYRAVVLGFVHRYLDPAILRMRLETFELTRTLEDVRAGLRQTVPSGPNADPVLPEPLTVTTPDGRSSGRRRL